MDNGLESASNLFVLPMTSNVGLNTSCEPALPIIGHRSGVMATKSWGPLGREEIPKAAIESFLRGSLTMAKHFKLRTYQRVPLCGTGFYLSEDFLGKGTVWDISSGGWRIKGDHQVQTGMLLDIANGPSGCKGAVRGRSGHRTMGQWTRFWRSDKKDSARIGEEIGASYKTLFVHIPSSFIVVSFIVISL